MFSAWTLTSAQELGFLFHLFLWVAAIYLLLFPLAFDNFFFNVSISCWIYLYSQSQNSSLSFQTWFFVCFYGIQADTRTHCNSVDFLPLWGCNHCDIMCTPFLTYQQCGKYMSRFRFQKNPQLSSVFAGLGFPCRHNHMAAIVLFEGLIKYGSIFWYYIIYFMLKMLFRHTL